MEPALQAAAKSSMRRNASHDALALADDAEYKYGTTNAERFTVKEAVNELVSDFRRPGLYERSFTLSAIKSGAACGTLHSRNMIYEPINHLAGRCELGLLENMLEQAGIPCALRNERLSQACPSTPFKVELWVEHDDRFPSL